MNSAQWKIKESFKDGDKYALVEVNSRSPKGERAINFWHKKRNSTFFYTFLPNETYNILSEWNRNTFDVLETKLRTPNSSLTVLRLGFNGHLIYGSDGYNNIPKMPKMPKIPKVPSSQNKKESNEEKLKTRELIEEIKTQNPAPFILFGKHKGCDNEFAWKLYPDKPKRQNIVPGDCVLVWTKNGFKQVTVTRIEEAVEGAEQPTARVKRKLDNTENEENPEKEVDNCNEVKNVKNPVIKSSKKRRTISLDESAALYSEKNSTNINIINKEKRGMSMGYYYGYNRVSTKEQNLDRGRKAIEDFCKSNNYKIQRIYEDKVTGKNFDRPRFTVLTEDVLREGDTLIVPEYDRLGRADETRDILRKFKKDGIRVIFLDIPTTMIDFSSFNDEMASMVMSCINDMLISFYDLQAKTELSRKQKRQKEGIEAMKARGEWENYGRPRKMSKQAFAEQYQRVLNGEIGSLALKRELGLHSDTYFRYVREYKKGNF